MKKPIDIKSLEWALFRHVKKMIQPIETDEETYKDHLSAVLCNCLPLHSFSPNRVFQARWTHEKRLQR